MYTEDLLFGVLWVYQCCMLTSCCNSPILIVEIEPTRSWLVVFSTKSRYTVGSISVFARDKFV
jgi:hypothetical protein